jgi:hypothetical protein
MHCATLLSRSPPEEGAKRLGACETPCPRPRLHLPRRRLRIRRLRERRLARGGVQCRGATNVLWRVHAAQRTRHTHSHRAHVLCPKPPSTLPSHESFLLPSDIVEDQGAEEACGRPYIFTSLTATSLSLSNARTGVCHELALVVLVARYSVCPRQPRLPVLHGARKKRLSLLYAVQPSVQLTRVRLARTTQRASAAHHGHVGVAQRLPQCLQPRLCSQIDEQPTAGCWWASASAYTPVSCLGKRESPSALDVGAHMLSRPEMATCQVFIGGASGRTVRVEDMAVGGVLALLGARAGGEERRQRDEARLQHWRQQPEGMRQ